MKFFLTTAIDYTNGAPHIGHTYEKVLADSIARFRRLQQPTFFLTGADQHGQKVQQAAEREGISPQELTDRITDKFIELWKLIGIGYDGYAATTDPRHKRAVQRVLQRLREQGQIYKAKYAGFYSVRQEQFLTDKERNEQGEFGPEWGEVIFLEEEDWYFRVSSHRDWLRRFVESRPEFVVPAFRRVELLNAIDRLSSDLCISRPKSRLSWGIEFPFDPDYVTFVWFDALLNYVTFAGYDAEPNSNLPDFRELWPCQAHVIGKDILVPAHGIYWPVMLHAMGFPDDQMPRLLVHGFWNYAGSKMSKSLGNVIDPFELVKLFGADALRYYLLREAATGQDADFSVERLVSRYNTDLANDLGNLLNRTIAMSARYRKGILHRPRSEDPDLIELEQLIGRIIAQYRSNFEQFQVHAALENAWELVAFANALIERKAPWKMAKDPAQADRLDELLYRLAETLRILAIMVSPAVPVASQKMLAQLNASRISEFSWGFLPDGHQLGEPAPVFPRIELPA